MRGLEDRYGTAENLRRFAAAARHGGSPLWEAVSLGVADDPALLAFLDALPRPKRQPNLLLAAVRYLHGDAIDSFATFRAHVLADPEGVAAVMRARRTQTNEPGRCALWLPLLAALPQPLALLEVGAAAGLCLLPDRYGYRFGDAAPLAGEAGVSFPCEGWPEPPARRPEVVWRAGIDLAPLDLADADAVRWLDALVWPGNEARRERLRAAIAIARRDPPTVLRGDLVERLEDVAASAPSGATLVVFHTAVLAYLDPEARAEFVRRVRALDAVWLSCEAAGVVPGVAVPEAAGMRFVLARDGEALATCDGHGAWVRPL